MSTASLAQTASVDWFDLSTGLAGGLALFLLGMSQVTAALKAIAGDRLRSMLARFSSNRIVGALTGTVTTSVIQSSSVTTVLTVGFVSAGLLSVTQSASIIIGANLGTTVTAQVIALDITEYALAMLAAGAGLGAASGRRHRLGNLGAIVGALGFVFLGLGVMSDAMRPLGSYRPFLDLLADNPSPVIGLVLGALFTGLVQSSSATTGIVVVMGAQGLLDLEMGIAIILGANIGTAVTAVLAAIGKSRASWRAASVHVLVNVIGAVAWVAFIGVLADLATWLSGDDRVGPASPQQFANAHTVFNALNTVVFLALLGPLVRLTDRIVPASAGTRVTGAAQPAFLDPDVLSTPLIALEMTRRELLRIGLRVRAMLAEAVPAALDGPRQALLDVSTQDDEVNALHGAVVSYLGELSRQNLADGQRRELLRLLQVNNELEQLADTVRVGLVRTGLKRLDESVEVSEETGGRIRHLHEEVVSTLDDALEAVGTGSREAMVRATESKQDFSHLAVSADEYLAGRLIAPEPLRVQAYSIESELLDGLRLVHRGCRRIARAASQAASQAESGSQTGRRGGGRR